MHLLKPFALASLLLMVATATFAQELIDDLPKQRKEAAREKPQPGGKAPRGIPRVDLIDDLSPEQKEAAERNAAAKKENAIPDNLADALARALRNSPAILVADAKVRQAQAELNEARLSVVQELTLAFQRRAHKKLLFDKYNVQEAKEKVKEEILEDEAKILYLLGVGADYGVETQASAGPQPKTGLGAGMMGAMPMGMAPGMGGGMGPMGGMPQMPGGMGGMMPGGGRARVRKVPGSRGAAAQAGEAIPENVRKLLDSRVDLDFNEQPLQEVLTYLEQTVDGDVRFVGKEKLAPSSNREAVSVTLKLKQVTVEHGLQALSDLTNCCFIVRDYGILVEQYPSAESYKQAGIPMIGPGMRGIRTGESTSEELR